MMPLSLIVICAAVICVLLGIWIKRRRDRARREMEQHSITADALHSLWDSDRRPLIFDVRQPLDLLANSEIIPGSNRIPPKDLLENPLLIPNDKDTVVYCTCPSDKTSRRILRQALDMHFTRIKFLEGGLAAWKAKSYPVECYEQPFHLDISA